MKNLKRLITFPLVFFGLSFSSMNNTTIEPGAYLYQEYLKPINQRLSNDLSNFDGSDNIEKQVSRVMERSNLKAVSIAIVKDEKLVYSQAFGYSDKENKVTASPENLFRIASVSKLITAVAVMKLVEEGKISLNDKVFGRSGFFDEEKYQNFKDPRLEEITIRNLLDHTSGWSKRYGDPAFNPLMIAEMMGVQPPVDVDTYLRFILSRRLSYTPGTVYSYSNIAYVFLGEIIGKATGMRYEDYVRYNVLFPLGITDMYIGSNLLEGRLANEVKYYEPEGAELVQSFRGDEEMVSKTYGGNDIELLGAAGGWIASAPELAKLMVFIDGFNDVQDVLSKKSIIQMVGEGPIRNPLGWKETTEDGFWYRTGNYAGTSAMICRRPDGIQWVFLTNSSPWRGHHFSHEINGLMNQIIASTKEWPSVDLFHYINIQAMCEASASNK